jgi:glyoxylase-like metal-dependent hydrolase (beta-lactamase superfamily II)
VTGWEEVGAGVFARRWEPWDVTVGAIRGAGGLLVVDTRASLRQADELRGALRALDRRPPSWVVNTHCHFDHTFGNARFLGAELWGHRTVPAALEGGCHQAPDDDEHGGTPVVGPEHLLDTVAVLDLGDRRVELRHLGPAHTEGDVVVSVPDAGVIFAGDLVEQSGPPAYGPDSFPLAWPQAVERLLDLLAGDGLKVVPGHGRVVGREFVRGQLAGLIAVAQLTRQLWQAGVPAGEALAAGADRWPWPPDTLTDAVRLAYLELSGGGGTGE